MGVGRRVTCVWREVEACSGVDAADAVRRDTPVDAEIVAVGAQKRQVAERDGDADAIADQSTCVVVPRVRDRGVGVRHRLGDERHRAGKLGGDV